MMTLLVENQSTETLAEPKVAPAPALVPEAVEKALKEKDPVHSKIIPKKSLESLFYISFSNSFFQHERMMSFKKI